MQDKLINNLAMIEIEILIIRNREEVKKNVNNRLFN
jgi:hypothetical protein